MPRLRSWKVAALAATVAATLLASAGCSHRYATTRIFLHGEVVGLDETPIPLAVVRLGDRETVADRTGHYRFLFLDRCLRAGVGTEGIRTEELEAFAPGFQPYRIGFELTTIELLGGSSCGKHTDKYVRLRLTPVK